MIGNQRLLINPKESNKINVHELCTVIFTTPEYFIDFCSSFRLMAIAKAFIEGKVAYRGDIFQVVNIVDKLRDKPETALERIRNLFLNYIELIKIAARKTFSSSEHYSLNTRVYELFLDKNMQYTCALFNHASDDLDTAQINKLQLIAESLEFDPGKKHLDIGCGWGGAIRYFADKYSVECTGITNCKMQADYAQASLEQAGIKNCQIVKSDFSDFSKPNYFDSITVVGMLEHVKKSRYNEFFGHIHKSLKPGGKAYIQCITKSPKWIGGDGSRFLQKYVFPGYHIDRIDNIIKGIKKAKLNVESYKDYSHDYALTTRHWLNNLMRNEGLILDSLPQRDFNIFIAYLSMASKLFEDGRGSLYRILLYKPE
ncbi:MAG: cyclopropane-fatty-acyl-phospholipid synthase family protein [Nitrospirae bacterium]|nr:cyclopropane-fatty-acyl-phospholipid synthase family protein [Nitrospirota bacterium]